MPTNLVRSARLGDVPALHALIDAFAQRQYMLARTTTELYETIRDFIVIEQQLVDDSADIVACAAVHVVNGQLAEVKSVAVSEAVHGQGLGRLLIQSCLDEAKALGLQRVFCLTYQVEFFTKLGFGVVDRSRLPEKVWGECVRCNKFLNCDEVAMWSQPL